MKIRSVDVTYKYQFGFNQHFISDFNVIVFSRIFHWLFSWHYKTDDRQPRKGQSLVCYKWRGRWGLPRKRLKAITNPPAGLSSRAKTYQGQDAANRCILPLIVELEGLVPNTPNMLLIKLRQLEESEYPEHPRLMKLSQS